MASLEYLPSLSKALTVKMIEDDPEETGRGGKNANKAARKKDKKQRSGTVMVGKE